MKEMKDLWTRALKAVESAKRLESSDPDAAASRAYYSAFFAVSALFASEGKTFSKHSALEAAVHRDLVKPGRWAESLGADYVYLRGLRETGDYGGGIHVSPEETRKAIEAVERILVAVNRGSPVTFALGDR